MRKFLAIIILSLSFNYAHAELVSIDVVFDDRNLEFNGVDQATGGITMSIVVDTNTPNLGTGFSDFANFYAADVFFTSPGLGLDNEKVSSDTYLYFGGTVFGFCDTLGGFSTIFTAYNGASNLQFGSSFDLSTLVVPQGPLIATNNELRTANDIVFENGDRITGGQDGILLSSSTTVSSASDVVAPATPVPTLSQWSVILLVLALGVIGFSASRKSRVR